VERFFNNYGLVVAFRKAMLPDVRRFISVEMIRDGGSFAAEFESSDGNQYILFTKVHFANVGPPKKDEHGYHQEKELVGYDEPVVIDCDPAKRPQDTEKVRYTVLSGPASRVPWDQARQLIGKLGDLAQGLSPIQASWLKQMTAVVKGEGHPPPGSKTRSTWHRGR
jgi:hypothetical protein